MSLSSGIDCPDVPELVSECCRNYWPLAGWNRRSFRLEYAVMFYCITVLKDNVYYNASLDAIAIVKSNDKTLHLLDVFSKSDVSLESMIASLANDLKSTAVILGFTPKESLSYDVRLIDAVLKDEVLFIQTGKEGLFEENKLMFPSLSHA